MWCVITFSMQLTPLAKTKTSSSGKSFPPLGPDTKVFVVWVERFDDIGRNPVFKLIRFISASRSGKFFASSIGKNICSFRSCHMQLLPHVNDIVSILQRTSPCLICWRKPALVWKPAWATALPAGTHQFRLQTSKQFCKWSRARPDCGEQRHRVNTQLQIKKEARAVVAWKRKLHSQYQMDSLAEFISSRECAVSRFQSDRKCQGQKRPGWVQS